MSHLQRLTFLVEFAQIDLTQATDRGLRDLAKKVDGVLNPDKPSKWHKVPPLDRRALGELQTAILALLGEIAARGIYEQKLTLNFLAARQVKAGATRGQLGALTGDVGVLVYAEATRDWLLYRTIRLLEDVGADRLRVCQAPAARTPDSICGRLFLKVTRKEYCSSRCQIRTYMRQMREEERQERQHVKTTRTR